MPLLLCLSGCAHQSITGPAASDAPAADVLAPGVVHRAIPTGPGAGVDLVDVDLARSSARPAIVTGPVAHGMGPARTPEGWLTQTHALAATNGGYFGQEDGAGDKEFIGLLVRRGRVVRPAPPLTGQGSATLAPGRYVRSAFGVTRAGTPLIAWAATTPALMSYDAPLIAHRQPRPWTAWDAVGCGPTLIQNGKMIVTDRRERLASPGDRPRTFVAYDGLPGKPVHFVLGVALAMTFADLAAFLQAYFLRVDGTRARAAMCLDGGESTQLSYRLGNGIISPRQTGVTVPDAVVIRVP